MKKSQKIKEAEQYAEEDRKERRSRDKKQQKLWYMNREVIKRN